MFVVTAALLTACRAGGGDDREDSSEAAAEAGRPATREWRERAEPLVASVAAALDAEPVPSGDALDADRSCEARADGITEATRLASELEALPQPPIVAQTAEAVLAAVDRAIDATIDLLREACTSPTPSGVAVASTARDDALAALEEVMRELADRAASDESRSPDAEADDTAATTTTKQPVSGDGDEVEGEGEGDRADGGPPTTTTAPDGDDGPDGVDGDDEPSPLPPPGVPSRSCEVDGERWSYYDKGEYPVPSRHARDLQLIGVDDDEGAVVLRVHVEQGVRGGAFEVRVVDGDCDVRLTWRGDLGTVRAGTHEITRPVTSGWDAGTWATEDLAVALR